MQQSNGLKEDFLTNEGHMSECPALLTVNSCNQLGQYVSNGTSCYA